MDLDQRQEARLRQFDENFVRVLNEAISRAPGQPRISEEALNDVLEGPSRAKPGHLHEVLSDLAAFDEDAFQQAAELISAVLADWGESIG
jgi:hypothetical protein